MDNGRGYTWRRLAAFAALALVALMRPVAAADLPSGMLLSALQEGQWTLYRSDDTGRFVPVPTVSQPRTPAISDDRARIAYIAADGSLREYRVADGRERTRVEPAAEHSLTQPVYGPDNLLAVRLIEGKSAETHLVRVRADGGFDVALEQRSAQLEPATGAGGTIYYGNISCTTACGRVIQEIWRYQPASGQARQLTRLNAVARQPFAGPAGRIWFSSNAAGDYHIWRLDPDDGPAQRVTRGTVVDAWPVVSADGTLYFLRQTPARTALMRLEPDRDTPEEVDLSIAFDQLKDLRLARCATDC